MSSSSSALNTANAVSVRFGMTQSANAAVWRWPLKVIGAGLMGVAASQYLAGFLFLWSFHLDTRSATPLTVARYAYYYADQQPVRRRLVRSSVLSLALVCGAALPLMLPRRRALHGDARFATRREIT